MVYMFGGMKYLTLLLNESHKYDKDTDTLFIRFKKRPKTGYITKKFYDGDITICIDKYQMPYDIRIDNVHSVAQREDVKRDIKMVPNFIVNSILERLGFSRKELGW